MAAIQLIQKRVCKPWGRRDLPEIFDTCGAEPVGEIWFESPGRDDTELLVKYLFTSERLSVQVHPGPGHIPADGQRRGKDEAWFVLQADPGAEIGLGLTRPTTREDLEAAARDGSIEDLIDWRPTKAGDVLFCPAGTVHALGGGLILIEIQQNIDLTYRLYDYGRPRDLHVSQAAAVAIPGPYASGMTPHTRRDGREILVRSSAFIVERWRDVRAGLLRPAQDRPALLVPVTGSVALDGDRIGPGEAWQVDSPVFFSQGPNVELLVTYPGESVLDELIG
jgi:mannose-6-phosphate isomerase